MSYQVLARKWRPQTFDTLVGQQHVLKALQHALASERVHHAYLFTGTRGVGKTTIARLLAKALNCEQGVTPNPCGVCQNCVQLAEGRFIDLIEVDAASRTRVEDTRELLENVQYAPTHGRYKVYLIDEVHMLSTSSFNALLKTLEEPPAHVKFLLATTDPQKLPVTILSRCLQFNLKPMTPEQVAGYLAQVLTAEQIPHEQDALELLGRSAQGSMRDALSLTDQAIAYGQGQVLTADVVTMLGTLDRGQILQLLQLLLADQRQELWQQLQLIADLNPDYEQVLDELLRLIYQLSILQLVQLPASASALQQQLASMARRVSSEDLQLYYQCGLQSRKDLRQAPDPRMGFDMALMRMLAFTPRLQDPERLEQLSSPNQDSASSGDESLSDQPLTDQVKKSQPQTDISQHQQEQPFEQQAAAMPRVEDSAVQSVVENSIELAEDQQTQVDAISEVVDPRVPDFQEHEPQSVKQEPEPELEPEPLNASADHDNPRAIEGHKQGSLDRSPANHSHTEMLDFEYQDRADLGWCWCQDFKSLPFKGFMYSVLLGAELQSQGNVLLLRLSTEQQDLWQASYLPSVKEAVAQWLAVDSISLQVQFVAPEALQKTPEAWLRWQQAKLLQQAQDQIFIEPQVQQLLAMGAKLNTETIKPKFN